MDQVLRINNWDDLYENSRTREMKKMQWVPVPCRFDGDGYTELLIGHENGVQHYAAWMAFLLVAAKCETRGTLVRGGGRPHNTTSIAAITKMPKSVLDEALPRLIEIGWIVSATLSNSKDDYYSPDCEADSQPDSQDTSQTEISRTRGRASVPSVPSVPCISIKKEELQPNLQTDDFLKIVNEWMVYKTERREAYKPAGLRSMLTHASNMAEQHGVGSVIAAMRRAMANAWKGWDQEGSFGKTSNGGQRGNSQRVGAGQRFIG